jgi:DnaD/phage-associated family protein
MIKQSFTGFPARADVTPLPNLFFTEAMSGIKDITELKTVLYVFHMLAYKRGYPRFVTLKELCADVAFASAIGSDGVNAVKAALHSAVSHNVLLHVHCDGTGGTDELYVINNDEGRKAIDRIRSGEIQLPGLAAAVPDIEAASRPGIYELYENNIGILTPIISGQLQEAERQYPANWIEDAFKEAVTLEKRNWKYILRILQRWAAEGKDNGTARRYTKKDDDRDKYVQGKYGHMVRR